LVLTDQSFVDPEKIDKVELSRSFRGRDLRDGILRGADLRKADFTGANLSGALLDRARLGDARFGCRDPDSEDSDQIDNEWQGPSQVHIIPPLLTWPDNCTWLAGASLRQVEAQGADFKNARMWGADFTHARLEGAVLEGAELHGAFFFSAIIEGAQLDRAKLYAAHLRAADLRGASLISARLDGATIGLANLSGISLAGASVYATRGSPSSIQYAEALVVERGAPIFGNQDFEKWRDAVVASIPINGARRRVQRRLEDAFESLSGPSTPEAVWEEAAKNTVRDPATQANFELFLVKLACRTVNAPYVLRGLIRNGRLRSTGNRLPSIVETLGDDKLCPGAKGLTPRDVSELHSLGHWRE
jgi:hypothetical protein